MKPQAVQTISPFSPLLQGSPHLKKAGSVQTNPVIWHSSQIPEPMTSKVSLNTIMNILRQPGQPLLTHREKQLILARGGLLENGQTLSTIAGSEGKTPQALSAELAQATTRLRLAFDPENTLDLPRSVIPQSSLQRLLQYAPQEAVSTLTNRLSELHQFFIRRAFRLPKSKPSSDPLTHSPRVILEDVSREFPEVNPKVTSYEALRRQALSALQSSLITKNK